MAEYPEDPGQGPEVPNTSRSEPSSQFDTRRFWWNHRPVVWWIMGGLGLLVVVGLSAALITAINTDTTEDRGAPPEANARPTEGSSAVAGQGAGMTLSVTVNGGVFEPRSGSVPRTGQAVFAVEGEESCRLSVDGDVRATVAAGEQYVFEASEPGEYIVECAGAGAEEMRLTVP